MAMFTRYREKCKWKSCCAANQSAFLGDRRENASNQIGQNTDDNWVNIFHDENFFEQTRTNGVAILVDV